MTRRAGGGVAGRVINLPAVLIVLADHGAAGRRRPRERALQRRDGRRSSWPPSCSSSPSASAYVKPENWSPFMPYGWSGRHGAARRSSSSPTSASTPSRRRPRRPRTRSATCRSASSRRWSSARCSIWPSPASSRGIVPGRASYKDAITQFLNAPVGFALTRHRPGLGGRPGLGRRRRRHHQRAARHAHEPAAHLLRDEPRRPAAAGRQQGAPAVPARPTSRPSSPASSWRSSPGSTPIQMVGEMTSIGTLFAFVVVCARGARSCASSGPTRTGRSGCRSARHSRCSASCRAST